MRGRYRKVIGRAGNLKERIEFTIPIAPRTKKNSQQIIINPRNKRPMVIPSKLYRQYEKDAGMFLRGKFARIEDPVNVKAIYYMPTRRKVDITNLHEALHDVLTHYAVVADDNSNIIAATDGSRVRYDKNNPRTEVTITPMSDEPCQQMMELDVKDSF